MKFFILIFVSILSSSSQNLNRHNSFLTADDFQRADKLSDEEIDRGEGIIDMKAEFNSNLYGGDIVDKPSSKKKDVHGYISRSSGRHWKEGRVPYQFVDHFTIEEKQHIAKAIQFFHQKTCIRIVPRNSDDRSYLKFVKKRGCFSQDLGRMRSGPQELSLGKGCIRVDIIIHELMHAIGFMHEFSRPDRDKYIDVDYDNIMTNGIRQFRKIHGEYFGDWNLPFDIKSAMFYEGSAAAKRKGLTVMRAKNGEELRCKPHLCPTELDVLKINKIYQCGRIDSKADISKEFGGRSVHNELGIDNCTSLEWKSIHQIDKETDNPVQFKEISGKWDNICRAKLWNGNMILGMEGKYGCRGTKLSGFTWNFVKYDILTNPLNVKLDWITAKTPPINAVYVGKSKNHDFYVIKCSHNSNSRSCLKIKYLTCWTSTQH